MSAVRIYLRKGNIVFLLSEAPYHEGIWWEQKRISICSVNMS